MYKIKQKAIKPLTAAIYLALGTTCIATQTQAEVYTFSFGPGVTAPMDLNDIRANDGLLTVNSSGNQLIQNTSYPYYGNTTWYYGIRTPISGSLTIDTDSMTGVATILPFDFLGSGPLFVHDVTLSDAGIDPNTGHQLILANMQFDWNGNNNIDIETVWDVSGLFSAIDSGIAEGDIITNGAIPSSSSIYLKGQYPIGSAPIATTTWNVSADGNLPLIDDSISGSPFRNGPFPNFNANFDITRLVVGDGIGVEFLNINISNQEGMTPECNAFTGGTVHYTANIIGDNTDPVTNVNWFIDGNMIATGITAEFNVPLGSHMVSATASTAEGRTADDNENIRVRDTVKPVISAKLIDTKTEEEVTTVETGRSVKIEMAATDLCDQNPAITGTAGFNVQNNDKFTAKRTGGHASAELSVNIPSDAIDFTIVAKDATGNSTSEIISLTVVEKTPKPKKWYGSSSANSWWSKFITPWLK